MLIHETLRLLVFRKTDFRPHFTVLDPNSGKFILLSYDPIGFGDFRWDKKNWRRAQENLSFCPVILSVSGTFDRIKTGAGLREIYRIIVSSYRLWEFR